MTMMVQLDVSAGVIERSARRKLAATISGTRPTSPSTDGPVATVCQLIILVRCPSMKALPCCFLCLFCLAIFLPPLPPLPLCFSIRGVTQVVS